MMPFTLSVYPIERGPSLIHVVSASIEKGSCGELQSKDYQMDNLVKVRFKFECNADKLKCNWSAMKLKSKASCVQLLVTCRDVKYSERLQIHTEEWTEYKSIGIANDISCVNNVLSFMIHISISVSEVNASDSHTKVYEDADCIDFHLKASDGEVGVHRVFLAAHSDVFRRMLNGKWKETAEGCVEVKEVTRQTLQHFKDYMYLGILPDDGLRPLLLLATCYLIEDLKTKCIKKLTETLKPDNLYALLEFACENNIPELTFEILHFTPNDVVSHAYKKKKKNLVSKSVDENLI